jgi:hypothetical protein
MNIQNKERATDHQALTEINYKIGEAEFQGDTQYLRTIMADDLIFRRASGDLVGKEQFLEPLEKGMEITVDKDTAVVTLLVWAKGQRNGTEFKGLYRNIRMFVKSQEDWQCAVWLNTKVG